MRFDLFRPGSFDRPIWTDDEAVQKHLDALVGTQVLPAVQDMTSASKLFDVLKLDLEPYRWFRTNPIVRTAYLVAIADRLGVSRVSVRDALAPYDVFITRQLGHPGSEFSIDGLMDGLVADWRAWCSAA